MDYYIQTRLAFETWYLSVLRHAESEFRNKKNVCSSVYMCFSSFCSFQRYRDIENLAELTK